MNEHPHRGGSYRREPDGSLTRIIDMPPAEVVLPTPPAAPTPPADEPRPTRSKRKETKNG